MKHFSYLGRGFAALLLLAASLTAQAQTGNVGVGTTQPTQKLDVDGNVRVRGAAGTGKRLVSADADGVLSAAPLSTAGLVAPTGPTVLGTAPLSGYGISVAVSGTRVYVGTDNALQIFDASTPATPVLLSTTTTGSRATAVAVVGTTAYVGIQNTGLRLYDVSNPASPVALGTVAFGNRATAVVVSGTTAYLLNNAGELRLFDVSNPAAPVATGMVTVPSYNSLSRALAVRGNYAYVVNNDGNLLTYDVSNRNSPTLANTFAIGGYLQGVAIAGSTAYIVDDYQTMTLVSLAAPAAPSVLSVVSLTGQYPTGIAVSGTTVGVLTEYYGLVEAFDVSNPQAVVRLGSNGSYDFFEDLAISGGVGYVATNGLSIYQLAQPTAVLLGQNPDGSLAGVNPGTLADNLGNHTATQNLNLQGHLLVGGTINQPSSTGLSVGNTGNVGIGVSGLANRLAVVSGGPAAQLLLRNPNGGSGATAALDFQTYNPGAATDPSGASIRAIDDGVASASLSFLTKQPGSSANALFERLRIASTGNVGIGTGSNGPSQKLEVAGQVFSNTGGFRFPDNTVQTTAAVPATGANFILNQPGLQSGANFNISGNGTIGGNGYVGGRLGVGTSGPGYPLTVQADASNRVLGLNSAAGTDLYNFSLGSTGLSLNESGVTPGRLFVESGTGNVGIGTGTPAASALLDVSSTSKGFLPPRLTPAQRDAIASPAPGLVVYNTVTGQLNVWNGTSWTEGISSTEAGTLVAKTFGLTGSEQQYTVPDGVTRVQVDVRGAQGGAGYQQGGGRGGQVLAVLAVTPGEVLRVYVGGAGDNAPPNLNYNGNRVIAGGYNGGGETANYGGAGAGGGASDIRQGGAATSNRVVVGGGGGGTYYIYPGGAGGGLLGFTGGSAYLYVPGTGATQTGTGTSAGGSGPASGPNGGGNNSTYGGGGGGGYFGGGAGGQGGSGGGGSGYADPAVTSSVTMNSGMQSGNGVVTITALRNALLAPTLSGANITNVPGTWSVSGGDVYRATGNVGIGTSSPGATLDVQGSSSTVKLGGLAGTGTRMVTAAADGILATRALPTDAQQLSISGSTISLTNGGSVLVPATPGDNLGNHTATQNLNLGSNQLVGNGGSTGLAIASNGNVGIGTTSPYTQLANTSTNVIATDGNGTSSQALNWVSTTTGYAAGLANSNTATNGHGLAVKVASANAATAALDISQGSTLGTAGTSLLRVRGDGNVGIGTAAPAYKLEVNGTALINASGDLLLRDANVGLGWYAGTTGKVFTAITGFDGPALYGYSGGLLGTKDGGNRAVLVWNKNGQVGIGNTDPQAGLHIDMPESSSGTALGVLLSGGTNGNPSIELRGNAKSPYIDFVENANLDYSTRLLSSGGTLNLSYGGAAGAKPSYILNVGGGIQCTAFSNTSDARFKQHVRPLTSALAGVLALRGVRYDWNPLGVAHGGTAGTEQVGLLAQEVEKIYPELVTTGADGYKGVNYAQLTPVLIEALKEQQAQIEALKARAATAEAKVTAAEVKAAQATATTEAFEARLRRLEAGQAQAQR